MQIKNIGAAALPALFHLFAAVSGQPCLRLPRCPCTLPVWPPPCKDSCKGRHKHAGPLAAFFAAVVPLRDYPSESVPFKDLCLAGANSGEKESFDRAGSMGLAVGEMLNCCVCLPVHSFFI